MRRLGVVAVLVAAATLAVSAHDFWLVPDSMAAGKTADIVVRGQTSSAFPTSESAVAVDRVTDARILGATDEESIAARSVEGLSLVLRHRPRTTGQKVIGASLGWRNVNETAESFRRYLVLEGAEDALKRYEQAGTLPTAPIVRRYAKYAKTVVEFGDGPRAFARSLEHPLEFMPLADPSALRSGSTLSVRLVYQGKPLSKARIHAGIAPAKDKPRTEDLELISSEAGVVLVPVAASGLWNVRAIHVTPAPTGVGADWEVHWASFVFSVK